MDLGLHLGTLAAVCLYFRRDVWALAWGGVDIIRRRNSPESRMATHLVLATIPAVLVGYIMHRYLPDGIRSVEVIAWTSILCGLLLWAADHLGQKIKSVGGMRAPEALMIGLAQIISLIPGVSRSGITMSMARLLGYDRREAARFSSLMSIPVTLAAVTLGTLDLLEKGNDAQMADFFMGAGMSFVAALGALTFMMRWLRHFGFAVFGIYRVLLGILLMAMIYAT